MASFIHLTNGHDFLLSLLQSKFYRKRIGPTCRSRQLKRKHNEWYTAHVWLGQIYVEKIVLHKQLAHINGWCMLGNDRMDIFHRMPVPDFGVNICRIWISALACILFTVQCQFLLLQWMNINSVRHSKVNSVITGIQQWTFDSVRTMYKKWLFQWFSKTNISYIKKQTTVHIYAYKFNLDIIA